MSASSLAVSAHLEVWAVAAEKCDGTVADGTRLPCVQLFGLHDGKVCQVIGTKVGLGNLEVDRRRMLESFSGA